MALDDFRVWLGTTYVSEKTGGPLGLGAASDYASRLRTLGRLGGRDLEAATPSELAQLRQRLENDPATRAGLSTKAIADLRVALGLYETFQRSRLDSGGVGTQAGALVSAMQARGFVLTASLRHVFELRDGEMVVYVKRLTQRLRLVVHPSFEMDYTRLERVPGVSAATSFEYYHNTSMRRFPTRLHGGQQPIHYGLNFDVHDEQALDRLLLALRNLPSAAEDQSAGEGDGNGPQETERSRMQKARIGQGKFRSDLVSRWWKCPLTGVSTPDLLRASHIKPWKDCTDFERLDVDNGLLLAVHLDGLFDKGFITFTDDGQMLISPALKDSERGVFGVSEEMRVSLFPKQIAYMRHHLRHVFLRPKDGGR